MNYINTLQAEFEEAFQDQKMLILERIEIGNDVRVKFLGTTTSGRQIVGAYTSIEGAIRPFISYYLDSIHKDVDAITTMVDNSTYKKN